MTTAKIIPLRRTSAPWTDADREAFLGAELAAAYDENTALRARIVELETRERSVLGLCRHWEAQAHAAEEELARRRGGGWAVTLAALAGFMVAVLAQGMRL